MKPVIVIAAIFSAFLTIAIFSAEEYFNPPLVVNIQFIDPVSVSFNSISLDYINYHNPSKEDSIFYNSHIDLIEKSPTEKNNSDYSTLAAVLWEMEKIDESEKMFLKIVGSTLK